MEMENVTAYVYNIKSRKVVMMVTGEEDEVCNSYDLEKALKESE